MPKMIDPELKARAVRLVSEHRGEYPTLTAASQAVAKQVCVGKESVRRRRNRAASDMGTARTLRLKSPDGAMGPHVAYTASGSGPPGSQGRAAT